MLQKSFLFPLLSSQIFVCLNSTVIVEWSKLIYQIILLCEIIILKIYCNNKFQNICIFYIKNLLQNITLQNIIVIYCLEKENI